MTLPNFNKLQSTHGKFTQHNRPHNIHAARTNYPLPFKSNKLSTPFHRTILMSRGSINQRVNALNYLVSLRTTLRSHGSDMYC